VFSMQAGNEAEADRWMTRPGSSGRSPRAPRICRPGPTPSMRTSGRRRRASKRAITWRTPLPGTRCGRGPTPMRCASRSSWPTSRSAPRPPRSSRRSGAGWRTPWPVAHHRRRPSSACGDGGPGGWINGRAPDDLHRRRPVAPACVQADAKNRSLGSPISGSEVRGIAVIQSGPSRRGAPQDPWMIRPRRATR
jgi:hypothetical protein